MITTNPARSKTATPPLQIVQDGVQMRLTIGQRPAGCDAPAQEDTDHPKED